MSFHTGDVELFWAYNFGATFRVPGFVTIGPDFRNIGSFAGEAQLKMYLDDIAFSSDGIWLIASKSNV
jgi:chitinase